MLVIDPGAWVLAPGGYNGFRETSVVPKILSSYRNEVMVQFDRIVSQFRLVPV